jgi:23S rRNA-intervening sequence protein
MSYREQFIWKSGIQLATNCYKLAEHFPKSELYGLTSQIRRASVSVPSNIAEGYGRKSTNERRQEDEGRGQEVNCCPERREESQLQTL